MKKPKGWKLNLGCGPNWEKLYPEYCGMDILEFGQEYKGDIRLGLPTPGIDFGWDEIMANHLLEHLTQDELRDLFANAHNVLNTKGLFRFVVPHKDKDKAWVLSHKTFWNEATVRFIEDEGEYYGFGKWKLLEVVTNERLDIHALLRKQ